MSSAAASFHQERAFEQVFADAHARMTAADVNGAEGYMVTVLETAGVTHNVFDYDTARKLYRHYTLSIDPTLPLNRETGSMERTVYYRAEQLNAFRHAMMIATRSAVQNQTIQYYRADREPQLVNTHFPLSMITYRRAKDMPDLPLPAFDLSKPPLTATTAAGCSKSKNRLVLAALIVAVLALLAACCYYR